MKALDWCNQNVKFRKAGQPITGDFDIRNYRMLQRPIESWDNPIIRRTIFLKASSCMGTVYLQMSIGYDTEYRLGDEMDVTMTDDYAKKWTKERGEPFILKLPGVARLRKPGTNSITQDLWQFANKTIYINGPSATKQEAIQVSRLKTDESHLEDAYPNGTLANFRKRLGGKWDAHELHVSTAPTQGRELADLYADSSQDEFHHRCTNCGELFWMLWPDDSDLARDHYNGEQIFHWRDDQSDNATLESLRAVCPHCQKEYNEEEKAVRYDLQTDGDYIQQGKNFLPEHKGFRYSCFAFHSITWRSTLIEWLKALNSERLGNFEDMESFIKRRLCMVYFPRIHGTGGGRGNRDYRVGKVNDLWMTEPPVKRFALFDVQDSPLHFWALAVDANQKGESRRMAYCKLDNWAQVKQFQIDHCVESKNVGIDVQHRFGEVITQCAENRWCGLQNSEASAFTQMQPDGKLVPNLFYGDPIWHDAFIGKQIPNEIQLKRKKLRAHNPRNFALPGFSAVIQWHKTRVGFIVLSLKGGEAGRYFGIPIDVDEMMPDYVKQLNTYAAPIIHDAKKGTPIRILKQLSDSDHSFVMECQAVVMMMKAGYFPMDFSDENKTIEVA